MILYTTVIFYNMKTLIVYNPSLFRKGGVFTFTLNFCKRMSKYYDITLIYKKASNENLLKIGQYVKVKPYRNILKADIVLLAAYNNVAEIKSNNVIQVVHADFKEQKKFFNIEYVHNPHTTKIVAVGQNVKNVFESMYPYKVDKVIYNML